MTDLLPASSTGSTRPTPPWITAVDGRRLRQFRRQHGVSRARLAYRAGVSPATVARLERLPDPRCRTRTLARIAAALGQPPAAIAVGLAVARPVARS
jgi:transcriptional regulator with XRE-family HTH domain